MALFDKLFGKKKEEPQEQKAPNPPLQENSNTAARSWSYSDGVLSFSGYDHKKVQAEIRERSLQAAKKVPGAEKFVLETRQTESHAEELKISEFFPVDQKNFVVFDLETTGIKYQENEIVEIGAVKVRNGEIIEEYQTLVKPDHPISAEASTINHITNNMLADQPKIYEVLPEFLSFVGDDVLVAHNVRFDYSFLANACMLCFFKAPELLFDTMTLARYYPEAESKKLTALAETAGIEIENAHRALSDARMTANLVLATNEKRKSKGK